ncbi:MAG: FtsX-like permease family protein [Knoellia sp.]
MNRLWLAGLLRRRGGRLAATAAGVALSVAMIAALGSFLSTSRATMTARATTSVATDWQVEVQPGADPQAALSAVSTFPGVSTALPVDFARIPALSAASSGSTQTTGAAVVIGLPPGYQKAFPQQIRGLTGASDGVLLAQQTASNLRLQPGGTVTIERTGAPAVSVHVDGVVDLPQADTLFQKVGAPPLSQPTAPPDNVVLVPAATFATLFGAHDGASAAAATTVQIHVARDAHVSTDPAAAYEQVIAAGHNLEARQSGAILVGNNLGAALDAARSDAAYAQMLFLFLGIPGSLIAALLTSALTATGATRRRGEQALLRLRGFSPSQVLRLAGLEAAVVGIGGGVLGLGLAVVASRLAFGPKAFLSGPTTTWWFAVALLAGLCVALATVLVPAARDLRRGSVSAARRSVGREGSPWWMRYGVDVLLLAGAAVVFWASGANNYALVLAPEGVATISVSSWAFLGPTLLWVGGALMLWRLTTLVLVRGRGFVTRLISPLAGRLAGVGAAGMQRQHRVTARSIVLLALALSFAASTATFNATYAQQAEADAQLTNGADVTVTEPSGAGVGPAQAADLARVPGVRGVEPLQHRFAYVGADLQDLYGVQPQSIRNVTALQDSYFTGGTAQQFMSTLAAHPDSILVSSETVKDFQLSPGDTLRLRLQDERTKALKTVPFHFVGVVKEFPTAPKDSFFVANASYVASATGSPAVGSFLVDTGGSGQAQVAAALRTKLGGGPVVTDLSQTRAQVGSSLTSVNLRGLTRLELSFAILLAAGAGAIILGVGQAERRRGTAILAVLGAGQRDRKRLLLSEATVTLLGGLIGGALIGWSLSLVLVKVLTGVFDPPPSSMAIPVGYLTTSVLAVVGALGAAALFGARASSRPPVEELRDL